MNKTLIVEDFDSLFIDHPLYQLKEQIELAVMTSSTFSLAIEKLVKDEKMDYLDATCKLCEQYEIDYSSVPKLLTSDMRDKIEMAATERKFRIGK
jgi:hypothetical protein